MMPSFLVLMKLQRMMKFFFYHAFVEREGIENNESKNDDAC